MDQLNGREAKAVENISLSIKEEKVMIAQTSDSLKAIAKTLDRIEKRMGGRSWMITSGNLLNIPR